MRFLWSCVMISFIVCLNLAQCAPVKDSENSLVAAKDDEKLPVIAEKSEMPEGDGSDDFNEEEEEFMPEGPQNKGLKDKLKGLKGKAKDKLKGLKDKKGGKAGGLKDKVKGLKGKAKGALDKLKGKAKGAADKIKGKAKGAADKIKGKAGSAKDKLKGMKKKIEVEA